MDILARQAEFLNMFPSKYREHIVEFSKMVESSDVDVLIFTARKAACFFHCLEYLRIWQSGSKIIVSERAKDHDLAWISGKNIAIVDEVIVTGTNLSNLINILRVNQARSVKVFSLFINKEWFVNDFLNGVQLSGFVPLNSADAQALGTTIVEAMHTVPRPYAVDYPISSWNTLSKNQFSRFFDSTEWQLKQTYCNTVPQTNGKSDKIEYFSLIPKFSLDYFSDTLALPRTHDIISKVRLYGRWEASPGVDGKAYRFRMVPYFIFPPLTSESLFNLFEHILQPLSSNDRLAITYSCTNDKARLRVMQYVSAAWVGALWVQHQHRMGLNLTFSNDAREIHYVFPHSIHKIIQSLCGYSRFESVDAKYANTPLICDHIAEDTTTINTFELLLRPFEKMYKEKEIKLRNLAKSYRREVLENRQFLKLLNRLNEGISVPELAALLPFSADSAHDAVSEFLDIAIDHGHVVPISVIKPLGDSGSSTVYRGFRHGEETYLLLKDREIFWLMLSSFFQSISNAIASDPSIPAIFLLKIGAAPKIYIEKILVLFLRYGLHEGIFNQAFTGEGAIAGRMRVRVAVDLHGARLAVGKELPTEMRQENAFVSWLINNKILCSHKSGGYILGSYGSINDGPDRTKKGKSKQFGILMSDVIVSLMKYEPKNRSKLSPTKRVNDALVALSTCETASSTILAIGAELRRAHTEFGGFPLDSDVSPQMFLHAIEKERGFFANALTAVNSAYLKEKLYLSRESEKNISLIDGLLLQTTPMAASVWETASDAFRRVWGRATVKDENHLIVSLLGTILPLQFNVHFFEFIILSACMEELTARSTKRLAQLPQTISTMIEGVLLFSDQLSTNQQALYVAASSSLQKLMEEIRQEWYQIQRSPPESSLENVRSHLARLLHLAEITYMQIDALYNQRGQIAPIKIYQSSLYIDFLYSDVEMELRSVLQRSVDRSNQGGPRAYSKPAISSQQVAALTFRSNPNVGHLRYEVFSTGPGAASWLGYLAAEALKLTPPGLQPPTIGVVLGLGDSYSAIVSSHDGTLLVPGSLSDAWEEQATTLISTKTSVLAQAELVPDSRKLQDFELTFESVLKSDFPRNRITSVIQSQSLGGKMESIAYRFSTSQAIARVAFVFTVQDELSTFLSYLRNQSIAIRRQAPSANEKMAWYATVVGQDCEFEVVAILNREMGSHDAAALMAEVGRVYEPAAMFLVGIAAALTDDKDHLGDVVVPTRVLDAHQTVSGPDGERNRSFDRSFPPRIKELIQGFFVERVERDRLRPRKFGQVDKRVRMTHIETDAALLRNNSPDERHRKPASSHSDKIDSYEMEASGVVAYLENTPTAPPTFVVKGLSDLGDPMKRDDESRYEAARNAIVVALEMAEYVLDVDRALVHK